MDKTRVKLFFNFTARHHLAIHHTIVKIFKTSWKQRVTKHSRNLSEVSSRQKKKEREMTSKRQTNSNAMVCSLSKVWNPPLCNLPDRKRKLRT